MRSWNCPLEHDGRKKHVEMYCRGKHNQLHIPNNSAPPPKTKHDLQEVTGKNKASTPKPSHPSPKGQEQQAKRVMQDCHIKNMARQGNAIKQSYQNPMRQYRTSMHHQNRATGYEADRSQISSSFSPVPDCTVRIEAKTPL